MSRNQLPERAPEGIDDQTWFAIHETFRKYDAALSNLDVAVDEIANAPADTIAALPVYAHPTGEQTVVAAWPGSATQSWGLVAFSGGVCNGEVTFAPTSAYGSPYGDNSVASYTVGGGKPSRGDYTYEARSGVSAAANTGITTYTIRTAVPPNFRRWKPKAIEVGYSVFIGGADGASSATATLTYSPTSTTTADTHDESGGTINGAYATNSLVFTSDDIEDGLWTPGRTFAMTLVFTTDTVNCTGRVETIGRIAFNWE